MRLLLLVLLVALPVAAQPLVWEVAGDTPLVSDGPPLVQPDGSFWIGGRAPATESPSFGVFVLPPPHGPAQQWTRAVPFDFDERGSPVVSFGPDTLFTYLTTVVARSIDGGATFDPLPEPAECQSSRMIEMPAGLPHAGRLLCGNNIGRSPLGYVAYSDDRGDAWTLSPSPADTEDSSARHLVVVRSGPNAGRVVAAGKWGLATSDDGGTTWQPTAVWQYFRYSVNGLSTLVGAAPGGGDRLIANVNDTQTGIQNGLFVSDDGGDTWTQIYVFFGNANTMRPVDLGGGSALAVFEHGYVRRTEDGGASWTDVGVVPFSLASGDANGRSKWAWQGPDGRLYVGGSFLSPRNPDGTATFGYTWRTVAPLLVADEASPERDAVGVAVRPNPSARGAVTVNLALASPSASLRVEVYDAVGRRVAVLHEGAAVGALSLSVDTSAWAPGVYTVRVVGGAAVGVETFTVVR